MSSTKKIVAVVGATGVQGGSVVRSLLADGTFAVRGLTRNVDSESAQNLKARGAEVVAADLDDIESLKKALKGVWGVFGVTDFWSVYPLHNYSGPEAQAHEEKQAHNLIDAAEAEGVQHFVWSTLSHAEPYIVYHFESKVNVEKYLSTKKVPFSLIMTAFYYSNLNKFGMVRKDGDEFVLQMPIPSTSKIPSYDAHDTGSWVLTALKNEPTGKTYHAYGESLSPNEYLEILRRVTGKKIRMDQISEETFHSEEFKKLVGEELWLNMKAFHDGFHIMDFKKSREENPKAQTFEEFLKTNAEIRAYIGF